jgi:phage terminase large subunit
LIDYKNPDYLPIIRGRIEQISRMRSDPSIVPAIKVYYKYNPADFISDWMVTYDPRKEPSFMPFVLWEKQREYIGWLWDRYQNKEDGLVEKCRDAGVTYLDAAFAAWLWIFWDGSKVAFGSRKEALVDKIGDPDTIFEKIRIILRNMPSEFMPSGYSEKNHATFMKVINPENGSTITGEAGDNIGRGGRNGLYFKDEAAFYERPELIDAALSQNSDVKIDVSTPNGNGNPFYKKRHGGKILVFVFDWRDDPRKDESWYQKQKDTLEPWILAQEVDRDYNASVEGICIPAKYVQAAVNFLKVSSGAIVAGLDVADEHGADENCIVIRNGVKVYHCETWNGINTTKTSRYAISVCNDHMVDLLNFDSIGVGAGVRGELDSLKEKITSEGRAFPKVAPVNVGSTELLGMYTIDRSDKDMFANLKASLWWRLRRRFERTYEHVNGIKEWPVDDMISIHNDIELISEISQPLRGFNEAGKIKIESKEKMKTRGIKSPNRADALALAFANADLIPYKRHGGSTNYSTQIVDYITGKTKIKPELVNEISKRGSNSKYVDFGD